MMPLKRFVSGKRGNMHRRQWGRNARKATHRRQGTLAAAMAGTVLILLLCLFLPGILLNFEGQRELGDIQQAKRRYYADNVSAADTIDFNLVMRTMMLEGRWKSEKTEIKASQAPEKMMSKGDAKAFCQDAFSFFTREMWDRLPQLMEIQLEAYWMSDEQKEYLTGNTEMSSLVSKKIHSGEPKLYMYRETVFNAYYFYVWEYTVKDEDYGLDLHMAVDAVTLDVYSMAIRGRLFDGLPWKEIMTLFCIGMGNQVTEAIQSISEIDISEPYKNRAVWLLPAWFCNYYGLMLYENQSFMDVRSVSRKWVGYHLRDFGTEEKGYTFNEGNFWVDKSLIWEPAYSGAGTMNYNRLAVKSKIPESPWIYMGFVSKADAFEWKISTFKKTFRHAG